MKITNCESNTNCVGTHQTGFPPLVHAKRARYSVSYISKLGITTFMLLHPVLHQPLTADPHPACQSISSSRGCTMATIQKGDCPRCWPLEVAEAHEKGFPPRVLTV